METLKILLNSPSPPAMTQLSFREVCDPAKLLEPHFSSDSFPSELQQCMSNQETRVALGLALVFLDKLLLVESTIPVASFTFNEGGISSLSNSTAMVIDAQAIEHLDILPPPRTNKQ
jgi:hypothetical protein